MIFLIFCEFNNFRGLETKNPARSRVLIIKWRDNDELKQLVCSKLYIPDIAGTLPIHTHKDGVVFREKYEQEMLSMAQISSQFLCSKDTVRRNLKAHGVQIRRPHHHHGHPAQPRYGEQYRKGNLVRHLGEARVGRTVVEMRKTGLTLRQIARFLDNIGVPTKCRGKKWHPEMVNRILKNVTGDFLQ